MNIIFAAAEADAYFCIFFFLLLQLYMYNNCHPAIDFFLLYMAMKLKHHKKTMALQSRYKKYYFNMKYQKNYEGLAGVFRPKMGAVILQ